MVESPYFCVLPFVGLCLEAGGRFKPCCKYKSWDSSLNATKTRPQELMQAPSFQKIRQEMLEGKRHEGCRRCWEDEATGILSFRQSSNQEYSKFLNIEEPKAQVIDFGFGNTCNAACITCESSSSRKWSEEDKKLSEIENNKFQRLYFPPTEDSYHWLSEDYKNIKQITHTQNEVLASTEFSKFLDELEEQSELADKSILISTNGSIWPEEKILEQLKKFKKSQIQISIDGVGPINEYIRYPLKWDKVASTTEKWVDFAEKNNLHLTGRCTVSSYNVLYLSELYDWWEKVSGGRKMSFGYCWFPRYLNPSVFKDKLKNQLMDKMEKFPILKKIDVPIQDTESEKKLFWEFTKKMDEMRDLNSRKTLRRLFEVIEGQ